MNGYDRAEELIKAVVPASAITWMCVKGQNHILSITCHGRSGRIYLIQRHTYTMIHNCYHEHIGPACLIFEYGSVVPEANRMLASYLLIRGDELRYYSIANHHVPHPKLFWEARPISHWQGMVGGIAHIYNDRREVNESTD